MGTEEAALLAAVLGDPDDDLPRLALADWWEGQDEWEGGDQRERAEFVRVQCRLEEVEAELVGKGINTASRPLRVERDALRRREGELHWSPYLWAPSGPRWHDAPAWGFGWRRGFVRTATCTASRWQEHGDLLLAEHPVEEVTLTTWPAFRTEGRDYPMDRDAVLEELGERWPRVRHWHLHPRIEPARTHGAPWQTVPLDSWQWG